MKNLLLLTLLLGTFYLHGQTYAYEPNSDFPYGRIHPDAPKEVADFAPLIGTCNCKSVARVSQNEWADTVMMSWKFKYIMNGMAVQDETLKEDGVYSGSIRQFNADSSKWYVHYYTSKCGSSNTSGLGREQNGKWNYCPATEIRLHPMEWRVCSDLHFQICQMRGLIGKAHGLTKLNPSCTLHG